MYLCVHNYYPPKHRNVQKSLEYRSSHKMGGQTRIYKWTSKPFSSFENVTTPTGENDEKRPLKEAAIPNKIEQ